MDYRDEKFQCMQYRGTEKIDCIFLNISNCSMVNNLYNSNKLISYKRIHIKEEHIKKFFIHIIKLSFLYFYFL